MVDIVGRDSYPESTLTSADDDALPAKQNQTL